MCELGERQMNAVMCELGGRQAVQYRGAGRYGGSPSRFIIFYYIHYIHVMLYESKLFNFYL